VREPSVDIGVDAAIPQSIRSEPLGDGMRRLLSRREFYKLAATRFPWRESQY